MKLLNSSHFSLKLMLLDSSKNICIRKKILCSRALPGVKHNIMVTYSVFALRLHKEANPKRMRIVKNLIVRVSHLTLALAWSFQLTPDIVMLHQDHLSLHKPKSQACFKKMIIIVITENCQMSCYHICELVLGVGWTKFQK